MTGILLDTNIVSTSSPLKHGKGDAAVREWLVSRSEALFLSAVSLGEVRAGVEKAKRMGNLQKANMLDAWLTDLVGAFSKRILPVDLAVAEQSGRLFDLALGRGWSPGWIDAQIGATSSVYELKLLTRNVRHFLPMDIDALDPFAALPQSEENISPGSEGTDL